MCVFPLFPNSLRESCLFRCKEKDMFESNSPRISLACCPPISDGCKVVVVVPTLDIGYRYGVLEENSDLEVSLFLG